MKKYSPVAEQLKSLIITLFPRIKHSRAFIGRALFGKDMNESLLEQFADAETTEAIGIADDLLVALDHLVQNQDRAVWLFHEAFAERAQKSALSESKGDIGFMLTLSKFLWRSPPERYFVTSVPTTTASVTTKQLPREFVDQVREALHRLSIESPRVLLRMKKHIEEKGGTYTELLRALFLFYYDKKDEDPYH